jgi:prophage tail gpP-like protein
MAYPQEELAELWVRNAGFSDWETVWVQRRYAQDYSWFRFTAAERDVLPQLWTKLQFKPGDPCTILLAGQQAVRGFIDTREVSYTPTAHSVMLIGKSLTAWPSKSSVKSDTGSFDGMSFEQVAREVLAPFSYVGIKTIGMLDATPFAQLQAQPGENIWEFLERIARPRGVVLGSDSEGNFLLIGDHTAPIVTELVEGVNIISCQCVIDCQHEYQEFNLLGQRKADDQTSGTDASEIKDTIDRPTSVPVYSTLTTVAEQPIYQTEAHRRNANEVVWNEATKITATMTVRGWLRDTVNLWTPGDHVNVYSPMAMLLNQDMAIWQATFTQDDNKGSITVLDLVAPWGLRIMNYNVGTPVSTPLKPGGGPVTGWTPWGVVPMPTPTQ